MLNSTHLLEIVFSPLRARQGPKTTIQLDNSPKCLAQKSGGWWGFGTEHIADISETIFWKIRISDESVYILKLQKCQYHKL